MSEYPITFKWIPGNTNDTADGLSRHPSFEADCENTAVVNLPEFIRKIANAQDLHVQDEIVDYFIHQLIDDVEKMHIHQERMDQSLIDQIRDRTQTDLYLSKIIREISLGIEGRDKRNLKNFTIDESGLLWLNGPGDSRRLCAPRDSSILEHIMWEHHDIPTKGHMGEEKTLYDIRSRYFWRRMDKTIANYVRSCEKCQRIKA